MVHDINTVASSNGLDGHNGTGECCSTILSLDGLSCELCCSVLALIFGFYEHVGKKKERVEYNFDANLTMVADFAALAMVSSVPPPKTEHRNQSKFASNKAMSKFNHEKDTTVVSTKFKIE